MKTEVSVLLKEYGLNDNEIRIYLYLVSNLETTAYKIAKQTGIHRSTCYDVLERLIAKGFVSKIEKKDTLYFSPNEISRVISSLKDKETILINFAEKIQEFEKKQENKIRLLEGAEGQKQFNFNLFTLIKEKEINFCYILGNTYASNLSSNLFIERLLKESKKFKIEYKGIWNPKFWGDRIINQYSSLGKNRFLDLPSKVTTIIYGEYVAFLYTTDRPYVVEIKNSSLAKEIRSYFLHLWRTAKK